MEKKSLIKINQMHVEKYFSPFSDGNKNNDFYGFKREFSSIIQQIPMRQGTIELSGRRGARCDFVTHIDLSCKRNIRAAFLNAVKGPDYFINSGFSEFKITISL